MAKTKSDRLAIYVYADWDWLDETLFMGTLFASRERGKEIFSFEYDEQWLYSDPARVLDPALLLEEGIQYADADRGSFGLFLDSSPDRWGRFLMQRREARRARAERRAPRTLVESDFLLGVHDLHRIGGLRFKTDRAGAFLDDNAIAAPPWTSLHELQTASLALEKDNEDDPQIDKWISQLINPGSSLGGARPKANIRDNNGHVWIAKFPSRHDRIDVGAWEMLINELAKAAGLNVPASRLESFGNGYRTFLSQRFDRGAREKRVHFSSAMNLLQRRDGENANDGVSYLELAELLSRIGSHADRDLEELWRRIVFFISVSNTDDHLRNHGFLLNRQGWQLAPAYDMNPVPGGDGLSLNISETDNSQDLELARSVAEIFRLDAKRANKIIAEVQASVARWSTIAERLKIPRTERELMASAFKR